jgi:hypothetical protein
MMTTARAQCLRSAPAILLIATAVLALPAQSLRPLSRAQLCVTEGALEPGADEAFTVTTPKMRAAARVPVGDAAEMRFTYLGPTVAQSTLGSGAVREQLGLKLRALDACNLVYVMWRLTPEPRLVVQTKSNPGQHLSRECTNHGYRTVKPRLSASLPALTPGQSQTLGAQLLGSELRASVDGRTVWQGELGSAGASGGPVGVRSDNVRLTFVLAGAPESAATGAAQSPCQTDAGE